MEYLNRKGLYFEEFEVGRGIETPGRTVTEADIVAFAALSGDWTAIHVDREYAAGTPFGERIAHGLLVLSIASGLAVRQGFIEDTIMAFRSVEWKFSLPVKIGDTVHVRSGNRRKASAAQAGGWAGYLQRRGSQSARPNGAAWRLVHAGQVAP